MIRALAVKVGHGARFLVARNVARGVPFYATVFTRDIRLHDATARFAIKHDVRPSPEFEAFISNAS